jgi:hypothetical protein
MAAAASAAATAASAVTPSVEEDAFLRASTPTWEEEKRGRSPAAQEAGCEECDARSLTDSASMSVPLSCIERLEREAEAEAEAAAEPWDPARWAQSRSPSPSFAPSPSPSPPPPPPASEAPPDNALRCATPPQLLRLVKRGLQRQARPSHYVPRSAPLPQSRPPKLVETAERGVEGESRSFIADGLDDVEYEEGESKEDAPETKIYEAARAFDVRACDEAIARVVPTLAPPPFVQARERPQWNAEAIVLERSGHVVRLADELRHHSPSTLDEHTPPPSTPPQPPTPPPLARVAEGTFAMLRSFVWVDDRAPLLDEHRGDDVADAWNAPAFCPSREVRFAPRVLFLSPLLAEGRSVAYRLPQRDFVRLGPMPLARFVLLEQQKRLAEGEALAAASEQRHLLASLVPKLLPAALRGMQLDAVVAPRRFFADPTVEAAGVNAGDAAQQLGEALVARMRAALAEGLWQPTARLVEFVAAPEVPNVTRTCAWCGDTDARCRNPSCGGSSAHSGLARPLNVLRRGVAAVIAAVPRWLEWARVLRAPPQVQEPAAAQALAPAPVCGACRQPLESRARLYGFRCENSRCRGSRGREPELNAAWGFAQAALRWLAREGLLLESGGDSDGESDGGSARREGEE